MLVDYDLVASWPFLRAEFDHNGDLALNGLGNAVQVRLQRSVKDLPEDLMADLYLWLRSSFPPRDDPDFEDAHVVGPLEALGHWRDRLLAELHSRGTPEAVEAMRRIAAELPTETWLQQAIAIGEAALRRAQWQPTSLPQLLRLAAQSRSVLVHGEADLLALLVRALGDIQVRLVGSTPESHLLWDTLSRRPKTVNGQFPVPTGGQQKYPPLLTILLDDRGSLRNPGSLVPASGQRLIS